MDMADIILSLEWCLRENTSKGIIKGQEKRKMKVSVRGLEEC